MSTVKKQLFEQLALIAHSLSSPQRIELLDYIAQSERGVEELSLLSGLTVANTSRHLQVLKQNGLVVMRKLGKQRLYQIAGDDIVMLISSLRKTAESHLAEMDRIKSHLASAGTSSSSWTSRKLFEQLQQTEIVLLDIRPQKEFAQGHIIGAINIPPQEIQQRLHDIPRDKTIVAYCRGPYCQYSYEIEHALQQEGVEIHRLEEGFPEWKAAGLPYETMPDATMAVTP